MGKPTNPRVLNLDELEAIETDIAITHKGVKHTMAVLTVERFIEQQKRAVTHQAMVAAGDTLGENPEDSTDIVTLMRDAISEFFPTLPINELEVHKLFSVFAWLNELSAQMNAGADDAVAEAGNGEAEETPAS